MVLVYLVHLSSPGHVVVSHSLTVYHISCSLVVMDHETDPVTCSMALQSVECHSIMIEDTGQYSACVCKVMVIYYVLAISYGTLNSEQKNYN